METIVPARLVICASHTIWRAEEMVAVDIYATHRLLMNKTYVLYYGWFVIWISMIEVVCFNIGRSVSGTESDESFKLPLDQVF